MTKIRILRPSAVRKVVAQNNAAVAGALLTESIQVPPDILNNTKAISRKRPFYNIDGGSAHDEEQLRPHKKMRIDVHPIVFPEFNQQQQPSLEEKNSNVLDESALKPDVVSRFIFPKLSRTASRTISQRFLSQIRQTSPADNKIS